MRVAQHTSRNLPDWVILKRSEKEVFKNKKRSMLAKLNIDSCFYFASFFYETFRFS